jgi:hypothetical protein
MPNGPYTKQTIELDCPPGMTRPGDLIASVIKGTNLPKRKDCFRFFGHWIWDYTDIDPTIWTEAQPIIRRRIKALYNEGVIRYGSW